jgi:hypothetical protein
LLLTTRPRAAVRGIQERERGGGSMKIGMLERVLPNEWISKGY